MVTDFVTGPLNHHAWVISKKNAHIHAETLIHQEISKICSTIFEISCLYVQYRDPKISRDSTQASCFLSTFLLMSLQAFHVGITLTACFFKAAGNRILCLSFARSP